MDDVALVGIGCRLPGDVDGPSSLWRFLLDGGDGVREVPADRWHLDRFYDPTPGAPGRTYTRRAGFLTGSPWDFDAGFFGLSATEATRLDPRQRLILEVTQQALDDAGLAATVGGRPVGVYLGAGGTGQLADRVARSFDLRGPSLTVDTACSSSLVAVHQAVTALHRGEIETAVVGGVTLLLDPERFVHLSRGRLLAPDGRSKAFDAAADGYGRGEGAGVVVLKPLAAALTDRDRIYAVIRGTGCNQDGRAATTTLPDGAAQAALMEQVTLTAGVAPSEVGYVEAHGTGSTVADPLELAAIGSALGAVPGRHARLRVGSVKSSVGHLEEAAGVVGLIKAALVVFHRRIPPQAGLRRLNPAIPFDRHRVLVSTAAEDFPAGYRVPVAAVNGFCYGGTNACAVLAAPPPPATPAEPQAPGAQVFPVSGRTEQAARELAQQVAEALPDWTDPAVLEQLMWSRRAHHRHRFAIDYQDGDELRRKLRDVARGRHPAGTVLTCDRPVFVCTDADPAWPSVVQRGLADPAFRRAAEEVDAEFRARTGRSLLEEVTAGGWDLRTCELSGPGTFLAQVGQAARLAALGVTPAAVLGQGAGEVTAARLAGALTLPDAVTVIHHRSRLLAGTAGSGGMLAVDLPEDEALPWLDARPKLCLASVDSPAAVTLSGPVEALIALAHELRSWQVGCRLLPVDVPAHSPLVDPVLAELRERLAGLEPAGSRVPLFSTVTGGPASGTTLTAGHWAANLREPARLASAVHRLIGDGHRVFLELGPSSALPGHLRASLTDTGQQGTVVTCDEESGSELAQLYVAGALGTTLPPGHTTPVPMSPVPFPAHPFHRSRLRPDDPQRDAALFGDPDAPALPGDRTQQHPAQWRVELGTERLPWLGDHLVAGRAVFPATGYLDAALAAAAEFTELPRPCLADVRLERPLPIPAGQIPVLRLDVEPSTGHFLIQSRPAEGGSWVTHATGRICDGPQPPTLTMPEPARPALALDAAGCYERLTGRVRFGPAFRRIVSAEVGAHEVTAVVDATIVDPHAPHPHQAHPAVLAAALQCTGLLSADPGRLLTPSAIRAVRQFGPLTGQVRVGVTRTAVRGTTSVADVVFSDFSGRVLLELHDVELTAQHPQEPRQEPEDLWYEPLLEPVEARAAAPGRPGRALVVAAGTAAIPVAQTLAAGRDGVLLLTTETDPAAAEELVAPVLRRCLHGSPELTVVVVGAGRPAQSHQDRLAQATQVVAGALGTSRAVQNELDAALVDPLRPTPRLRGVMVTRHALAAPGDNEPVDPAGAGLIGVRRVLRDSQPGLLWRLVDIDDRAGTDAVALQCRTHGTYDEDPCDELALRGDRTLASVMRRTLPRLLSEHEAPGPLTDPEADFAVEAPASRRLADLALRRAPRREPAGDQVELRIEGFTVNPKDALKVQGGFGERELAGTAFGTDVGMEALGVVTRVGAQVEGVRVGDRRWVSVPGLARRYVTTRVDDGVLEPIGHGRDLTFLGSGLALMTAHHCLHEVARVRPGEWVLVLGGSSGLALACTHVAARAGAHVIATAADPEQTDLLRRLGAVAVLDSHLLGLLEQARGLTQGRGVDVVVSTCPGEAVLAGLEAAAEFGRVIEADGSEVGTGRALPMSAFEKNLSFATVDLDRMLRHRPEQVRELFRQVRDRLETGEYRQLPTVVMGLDRLTEAFTRVHQGELAGRVVVSMGSLDPAVKPARPRTVLDPDARYLVTGGLRGPGQVTAHWLADIGARRLLLVDEDPARTPGQLAALGALTARGVDVVVEQADLTDPDAVLRLLDRPAGEAPLRGIVHAAGVAEDHVTSRTGSGLQESLARRAGAAWNLHAAADRLGLDLDRFVLFSSVSSLAGAGPQPADAAANTIVDALTHHRRALGLPATTVNWGAIAAAVTSREDGDYLALLGMQPLEPDQALPFLDLALALDRPQVGLCRMDWAAWAQTHPASAGTLRFRELLSGLESQAGVRAELAGLAPQARVRRLTSLLTQEVAGVLGIPGDTLDLATPLPELGLDSLLAIELGARVNTTLGLDLPVLEYSRGLGVACLAARLVDHLEQC